MTRAPAEPPPGEPAEANDGPGRHFVLKDPPVHSGGLLPRSSKVGGFKTGRSKADKEVTGIPNKPDFLPGGVARGRATSGSVAEGVDDFSDDFGPGPETGGSEAGAAEGAQDEDVLLTVRQQRRAHKEDRRQAKDAAYELRQKHKRTKDGTYWRGHRIVDTTGLAEAFPEPETLELQPATVRNRITHGVTLVLLMALVVTGVVLAGMVQRGELQLTLGAPKPTIAPVSCPSAIYDYAPDKTVTVNVYNAGSTEGRAAAVAEDLKSRGFLVKEINNKSTEYAVPAVIVSGPSGHAAAFTLQRNIAKAEYVQDDRKDGTVDVILTSKFTDLLAVLKVDETPGALSCPRLNPPPSTQAPTPPPAG